MFKQILLIVALIFLLPSSSNAQGWEPHPHDNSELSDKPLPKIPKIFTKTAIKEAIKKVAPILVPHVKVVLEVVIPNSIGCDENEVSEYCD